VELLPLQEQNQYKGGKRRLSSTSYRSLGKFCFKLGGRRERKKSVGVGGDGNVVEPPSGMRYRVDRGRELATRNAGTWA